MIARISSILALSTLFYSCSTNKPPIAKVQASSQNVIQEPISVRPEEMRQLNPFGAIFEIEQITDTLVPKVGPVATYRCTARNFVPDQTVLLVRETLTGTRTPVFEYRVDDDGTLGRQYLDGTMVLENDTLLMFDFFRGEAVRYWLVTTDGKTRIGRQIIPYPIKAKGRDGAELSVRRLASDARLVLCEGSGFLPDEVVYVTSKSGKQLFANVGYQCVNGNFSMLFEPGVEGASGGVALIEVRRAHERLSLEYEWGCEAFSVKRRVASSLNMDADALARLSDVADARE